MTLEDVIKKTILPMFFMIFWYYIVRTIMGVMDFTEIFYFIVLMGFPYGVRKMFLLIIPKDMDIGATTGMMILGVLLGAIIGFLFVPYYIIRAFYVLIRYIFQF